MEKITKIITTEERKPKERNSNMEVLRIIAMFLIVLSHYTVHNGVNNILLPFGINRLLLELVSLGNIGSILFIFISGYYLIDSQKVKLSKLFRLWFQVFFYAIGFYIIFILLDKKTFSLGELKDVLFPITFQRYWFASVYVVMYLFHPYLNKLINSLNKKEHLNLIFLGIFLFSLLSALTLGVYSYYANQLIQFFLFYIIGSFFRKYDLKLFNNKKNCWLILIFTALLMIISVLVLDVLGTKVHFIAKHSMYFFDRTSVLAILLSTCIFNLFKNSRKFYNSTINKIAGCMFGVYLISDNYLVREYLWMDLFKNARYVDSNILVLHMFGCVFLTMIVCVIIDYLRMSAIKVICKDRVAKFLDKMQNKISQKVFQDKYYE